MTEKGSPGSEPVRAAEVIASACLATDLGMGFPFEHGLHGTLMAMRLADLLDVDRETESQTYYASLLMYSGCTTDADIATRIFGGPRTESITPVQFGSIAEVLGGVIRSLPPPDDPPPPACLRGRAAPGPGGEVHEAPLRGPVRGCGDDGEAPRPAA